MKSTIEREALGMIFAIQKTCHYLLDYPFTFYVDHDALKYLINKPHLHGRPGGFYSCRNLILPWCFDLVNPIEMQIIYRG